MNLNEHLQSKLQLLNNYALCLQNENQSKNKEIATLHNHLDTVSKENQNFRAIISQLRYKTVQEQPKNSICRSLQTSLNFEQGTPGNKVERESQTEQQMGGQQCQKCRESVHLGQELLVKTQQLEHYHSQCEEMYEAIVNLQKALADKQEQNQAGLSKIEGLSTRLHLQGQKRKQLQRKYEQVHQTIQSFDEESLAIKQHYSGMEMEMQSLISQNNQLIERARSLEKEKNNYYHQLKKMSRVSFGKENLGSSAFRQQKGKIKDKRWKQIEGNLQKLRRENSSIQQKLQVGHR